MRVSVCVRECVFVCVCVCVCAFMCEYVCVCRVCEVCSRKFRRESDKARHKCIEERQKPID